MKSDIEIYNKYCQRNNYTHICGSKSYSLFESIYKCMANNNMDIINLERAQEECLEIFRYCKIIDIINNSEYYITASNNEFTIENYNLSFTNIDNLFKALKYKIFL
jgi:hypothetical protein